MRVDDIEVPLTSPDRVLFPEDGITKADLADYYRLVAKQMLPHLKSRPINLQRFPRGVSQPGFIQQQAPESLPEWVQTVTVAKEGGETTHIVCDDAATLVWLANLSCITLHAWLSCGRNLDVPDRMVLDLDPAEDDFESVRSAARLLKETLDARELPAFLMTTGSRGLHVTVPLDGHATFDEVRDFSQEIAAELVWMDPQRLTTEIQKDDRGGRLFVDTLRNAYGHTAVTPYSVRAREGAPVACPIQWEDLDDPDLNARRFRLKDADKWLRRAETAWAGFEEASVRLDRRLGRTGRTGKAA